MIYEYQLSFPFEPLPTVQQLRSDWSLVLEDLYAGAFSDSQIEEIEKALKIIKTTKELCQQRIAVIFSGEYRTGNEVLARNANLFSKFFKNVDFFVVTRKDYKLEYDPLHGHHFKDSDFTVSEDEILSHFKNQSCYVKIVDEPKIPKLTHNYARHLYLQKQACELKQQIEKQQNIVYDQVIHTRPDLFFKIANDREGSLLLSHVCQDGEIIGAGPIRVRGEYQSPDCYLRMNSHTHNQYCAFYDNLKNLIEYAGSKNIKNLSAHTLMGMWLHYQNIGIPNGEEDNVSLMELGERVPDLYKKEFAYCVIRKHLYGRNDLENMDFREIMESQKEYFTPKKVANQDISVLL